MSKVTIRVPETTWRRARVWAAERDTSITAITRYLVENLPSIKRAGRAFPVSPAKSAPPRDEFRSN